MTRSISELQEALKVLGYDPGPVDGRNGIRTKRAVRAFQKAQGLLVDGKAGRYTWQALAASLRLSAPEPAAAMAAVRKTKRSIKFIVIHASATRPAMGDIGAREIDAWHRARGWSGIGYHYVIRRSGELEEGRDIDRIGSHVAGHNTGSLGICLVGGVHNDTLKPENNYTAAQWATLKRLLTTLSQFYPNAKVRGHRDFPKVAKACPCFDAIPWAKQNGFNGG